MKRATGTGLFIGLFMAISGLFSGRALAQEIEITPLKVTELQQRALAKTEGVVVINFWSTWCKPCIEEIPHFVKVYDSLRAMGVQLWLVSQDTRALFESGKLKSYIAGKKGWNRTQLFWLDETNADYYCPIIDPQWSGVIPATLILHNAKGYRRFLEQPLSEAELLAEIMKAF